MPLDSFDVYNKNNTNLLGTSGLVTWKIANWVTLPCATMIVLNAETWIGSISDYLHQQGQQALEQGRGNDAYAADALADELDEWLEGSSELPSSLSYISVRQMLCPRVVVASNSGYERHVARLLALAQEPKAEEPKFLWTADARSPRFYVVESHEYLARNCGPGSQGVVVGQTELNERIGALVKALP